MLCSLEVKPSGVPPQDLDTQLFHLLIVVLLSNLLRIELLCRAGQAISYVWPNLLASRC